ncbi:MAG: hypothetical protein ACI9G1_000361 [Pirellulaceae bacterium]|jgi:hypothetical protein
MYSIFVKHRTASILGVIALAMSTVFSLAMMGFRAAQYEVKVQTATVDSSFDDRYRRVDELLEVLKYHTRSEWLKANIESGEKEFRAALESYQAGVTAREKSRHLAQVELAVSRIQQLGSQALRLGTGRSVQTAINNQRAFDTIHDDQLANYHQCVDDYNRRVSRFPEFLFGGEPASRLYPDRLADLVTADP